MNALKALLVATLGAFAVSGLAPAEAQNPIKVGVSFPLSGGAGPQGQHVVQAIQAMAALINESGGVLGRPIELLVRDDESTPAVGVSRANELISAGVSVIIEGWNSPVTLAMLVQQRVPIRWTPCRFGGERPWFVCDVSANGVYCHFAPNLDPLQLTA